MLSMLSKIQVVHRNLSSFQCHLDHSVCFCIDDNRGHYHLYFHVWDRHPHRNHQRFGHCYKLNPDLFPDREVRNANEPRRLPFSVPNPVKRSPRVLLSESQTPDAPASLAIENLPQRFSGFAIVFASLLNTYIIRHRRCKRPSCWFRRGSGRLDWVPRIRTERYT